MLSLNRDKCLGAFLPCFESRRLICIVAFDIGLFLPVQSGEERLSLRKQLHRGDMMVLRMCTLSCAFHFKSSSIPALCCSFYSNPDTTH